MFVTKKGIFRPAGGEAGRLSRQMPGLEPTAYVVFFDRTYAVQIVLTACQTRTPAKLAAACPCPT
jgi:hypothetical protein